MNNGEKDGPVKTWYPNGEKQSELEFINGRLVSSKVWNEDGSVKE